MPNRDGIAQPWGARTPYGPGEAWPVRVDMHLADGVSAADVEHWVPSASILHSNGDGMDIAVKGARIVGVRGRADDRVNHGRLDPKDLFGWQANNSPDRLTTPLVRENGRLVESTWDEAMTRIVERSKDLLREQGASAIGFYTSGQLFSEEYYTLAAIGHGAIGTNHMDGNTRLCTATAAEALKESFGCDGQPGSYTDIDHADVIALFGHNAAETQAVLWSRILDRLAGPNPPQVLCVDPRLTPVARAATVHLAPLPGTNLALMNGLLHEIIAHDWVDHDYIDRCTVGFDELVTQVQSCTPEKVAGICGVPADQIRRAPPRCSAVRGGCCPRFCRASTSRTRPRPRELTVHRPEPGLLLLADLRRLHRKAAGVSPDWELLAQGAQAAKKTDLLALAERCHPETLRQLKWTNATLKVLSPQILVS
ncbi:molybdopterin-dependent oxidoreductase [Lentzea sp. E54]|uniref:molybdopterin-dependent oxidoreductase n=1 Tax=Lentzea xerophila TaxID=3435883 RepID=UPI003DA32499